MIKTKAISIRKLGLTSPSPEKVPNTITIDQSNLPFYRAMTDLLEQEVDKYPETSVSLSIDLRHKVVTLSHSDVDPGEWNRKVGELVTAIKVDQAKRTFK